MATANKQFYSEDEAIESFRNLSLLNIDDEASTEYVVELYKLVSARISSQIKQRPYDSDNFDSFIRWFVPQAMLWTDVRNGDIGLLSREEDGHKIAYDPKSDPFETLEKQLEDMAVLEGNKITWYGSHDDDDLYSGHGTWLVPVFSNRSVWVWRDFINPASDLNHNGVTN